jgi:hypothetical protein
MFDAFCSRSAGKDGTQSHMMVKSVIPVKNRDGIRENHLGPSTLHHKHPQFQVLSTEVVVASRRGRGREIKT